MAYRLGLLALLLAGCSGPTDVVLPPQPSSVRVEPPDTIRVEVDPLPPSGTLTMPYTTRVFASPDTASPHAEVTALSITPGADVYVRYRTRSERLAFPSKGESLTGKAAGPNRMAWGVEGSPEPDTVTVDCPAPFRGFAEGTKNIVTVAQEGGSVARAIERLTRPSRWLTLLFMGALGAGLTYGLMRLRG